MMPCGADLCEHARDCGKQKERGALKAREFKSRAQHCKINQLITISLQSFLGDNDSDVFALVGRSLHQKQHTFLYKLHHQMTSECYST